MSENIHPHPGLVLKCRLRELKLAFFELALRINFDEDEMKDVIDMKMPMSLTLCTKLSQFFSEELDFWIKLQVNYELSLVAFETSYPTRVKRDILLLPLPDKFG